LLQSSIQKIALIVALMAPLTLSFAMAHEAAQPKSIDIHDENGGAIIDYAMRLAEYREGEVKVRITGRCDSACTLFLSLPTSQLCISENAYFRFHAPIDDENKIDPVATELMMRKYPEWVRTWIAEREGLDSRLLTMTSEQTLPHVPRCSVTS
jgi:hypothetical protein